MILSYYLSTFFYRLMFLECYIITVYCCRTVDVADFLRNHVDLNGNGVVDPNEFRTLTSIYKHGKVPILGMRMMKIIYARLCCEQESYLLYV